MANLKGSKHSRRNVPSVDRISALPDSLVCHILSYLPTQFAVQTTILSKRWINLWTSITSLHFKDNMFNYFDEDEDAKRCVRFVYRVLLLLKTPCLRKFYLRSILVPDSFHLNTWVSAALSRHVQELIIKVDLFEELFHIPVSLFTCKSLSYLSLSGISLFGNFLLDVPNLVCLPNLKYLKLSKVTYTNDESIRKLLSGCPVLEQLFVKRVWDEQIFQDNVVHFSISSPTLKSLDLFFFSSNKPVNPRHTLEIDAPMLQYLFLCDRFSSDYVIGNLSSVVEAHISIYDRDWSHWSNTENDNGDKILKLLNRLSHVKFLYLLGGATMEVLSCVHELVADLPNLSELEGHFNTSKLELWSSIHPAYAPKGWLSHLTTVEITDFDGSTNELTVLKFILNGAKSLERMTIRCKHPKPNPEIKFYLLQELTKFPKDSTKCEVEVY